MMAAPLLIHPIDTNLTPAGHSWGYNIPDTGSEEISSEIGDVMVGKLGPYMSASRMPTLAKLCECVA